MPNELPAQLAAWILECELAAHAPTCARRTDECLACSCCVRFVGPNGEDGVEGPYRPCSAGPAPRQVPRDGWRNLPPEAAPVSCTGRTSYAPPGPQPLPTKEAARAARIAADFENADPNGPAVPTPYSTARAELQALDFPAGALRPFESYTHESGGPRLLCLPHPSGLNSDWNVPGAFERARAALRGVAPAIPWGEAPAPHKIKLPPTEPHDAGGFHQ